MKTRTSVFLSMLVCILMALPPLWAYADELCLVDGSVIRGKIVEVKNNVSYRILTKDGSEIVYPVDKVVNVKFTDLVPKEEPKPELAKPVVQQVVQPEVPKQEVKPEAPKPVLPSVVVPSSEQYRSSSSYGQRKSEKGIHFEASFSIVISPKYADLLDDAYPDTEYVEYERSGGYGWIDVDLGARWIITDQLSLSPTVGVMFNYVDISGYEDDTYTNTIIVPRIAARFQFVPNSSPYIGVELNYNSPHTGSDRYDFESGGLGYGAFLGYTPDGKVIIEAGYLYIPVDIPGYKDKENIAGGFLLRFGSAF